MHWRGTSAGSRDSQSTCTPAAGAASSNAESRARSGKAASSIRASTAGLRSVALDCDACSTRAGHCAEAHEQLVGATAHHEVVAVHGDVVDRVWGSHLSHAHAGRASSSARAATTTRSSGLWSAVAWATSDRATPVT